MIDAAATETTSPSPPITASQPQGTSSRSRPSTNTCFGISGSAWTAHASAHSDARRILSRSIRAGEAKATANDAVEQISSNSSSRRSGVSRLESSMPLGIRLGSSTTAAATTGPASGPRPASSQPATGQTPRLISARSRRKLGGATAITPFGRLALSFSDLSRIMRGWWASNARRATGNSAQFPLFNPRTSSRRTPGPIPRDFSFRQEVRRTCVQHRRRWLWVPAFAGTTHERERTSAELEQTQLLPAALRPREMIGGQFRTPLVEPELFAGDLEPASDHPGHRPGALHPRAPLRIVVAAAAHVADQRKDVPVAVGIVGHQPFAEKVAHLERQPQQHIARFLDAGVRRSVKNALDLGIVQCWDHRRYHHRGR